MEIKTIKLYKGKKIGLPGYSSLDVQFGLEIEAIEGEEEVITKAWEIIDKQIEQQLEKAGVDPEWIRRGDYAKTSSSN